MLLETKRLILKKLSSSHAAAYVSLSQNDGFRLFQISDYRRCSIHDAEQWITEIEAYHQRNGFGVLGVFKKENTELIGLCALKYLEDERKAPVELMYRLSDLHWGHGYGLEIGRALISYAFDTINLSKLVATVDARNIPSKNILAKLGFQFQKMIKIESFAEELHELHATHDPSF